MQKTDKYAGVKTELGAIYHENKGRYGYRRITIALRDRGILLNPKTMQRLMQQMGLVYCVGAKKYRSYKGEVGKIATNLLNRDFRAKKAKLEAGHRCDRVQSVWTEVVSLTNPGFAQQ